MKSVMSLCLLGTMLALPSVPGMAQKAATPPAAAAPKDTGGMVMCPMMGNMGKMQKDMASMMQDMDGMMKSAPDSAMKERMQKMRDQMKAMMQMMDGGMGRMMGNGMMQGK